MSAIVCAYCDKPATCVGRYDVEEPETPCCDECCGHGNEDGHCRPIGDEPAHTAEKEQADGNR